VKHALELEPAHVGLERLRVALDVAGGGLVVLALCEIEQLRGVRDALGGPLDLRDLSGEARSFAA
jgi:hypothetical protein